MSLTQGQKKVSQDKSEPVLLHYVPQKTGVTMETSVASNQIANGEDKLAENGEIPSDSKDKKSKKKEEKEEVKVVSVGQVFRFADGKDKLLMVLGTLCALLHGAALPALMIVFGDMVDSFVDFGKMMGNMASSVGVGAPNVTADPSVTVPDNPGDFGAAFTSNLMDMMRKFAVYYVIIAVCVLVLAYGQVAFWLHASLRQCQKIRVTLFQSILRQDIGWYDTHETGELNTRLSDDVNKVQDGIGDKIGTGIQWFSSFVSGFIIGFVYGWKLTLVIIAVSPLLAICGGVMGYLTTAFTNQELQAYAKAGGVAEEVLGAIRTVVAFGGQNKESERYNSNLGDAKAFGIKKSLIAGVGMGMVFFVMFACYALAFWYGSQLVREGEYSAGQLLIVFFCVLIGAFSIGNASPNVNNFSTARGAAYKLFEIIDTIPPIDSSSEEGITPDNIEGNVEFRDVVFRYPSRTEVTVLQGFNLKINVGETVALVGASGCGKSTTVQLLQRFYDPEAGQITVDGVDIRDYNIKWLRRHIGVVSQEPILFGTTIAENIRYGRDDVTQEEMERATKEANAYDFIMNLPQKFETLVGERGAQLSGGQKQRVAIARALVRDPKILLLDEATSALDTESEATVQAALDKARQGRTTLVIAHRLSTIKTASQIAGLQDGAVVEKGTHEELMQQTGVYNTLVTNQTNEDDEFALEAGTPKKSLHRMLSRGMSMKGMDSTVAVKEEEEKYPEVSMLDIMRLNSPEIGYMLFGCLASLINGGMNPAFAILFAEILGVYAKPVDEQEAEANLYSLMFLLLGVAAGLAMFAQSFMFGKSGEELTERIRKRTFKAMLRQEIAFFDDHKNNVGALTTRLATEASAVQGATGARLGMMCQSMASIGVGIIIGFIYSWQLTLCILAFVPFLIISGALQMKIMQGFARDGTSALEDAGKVAIEAIENIRTVAALTKEDTFIAKYKELTGRPYKQALKKAHLNGIAFSFSQAIIFFAYAGIFILGAYLVEERHIGFVDMFRVFGAVVFGAMAVGQAGSFAPDYGKAKEAAAKIFFLFNRVPPLDSYSEEGEKLSDCSGNVAFEDVHFRYPTRDTVPVLQGLTLSVKSGQTLALVGSSGCGKSTTVQLIERFYDPNQGMVTLEGQDISKLHIQWLRSQMGIVSQEPILFDCSIKDNIAYGDNSRDVPMDEIIEAAKQANIHNFIDSLPQGYDTNVGDKGTQLSGGQKQRVAIARALIRNPKILLLDEATSALDTESEKVVQEALDKAQEGRTSIVIAHRLSTIQNADLIAVIHNGKVMEMGTHSELLNNQGLYFKLHKAQMRKN